MPLPGRTVILVLYFAYLHLICMSIPNLCKNDGYFGTDCVLPCRYPNYGADCQKECNCDKNFCHHVSGCAMKHATDEVERITTLSVNDSGLLQNETKMNILYMSTNISTRDSTKYKSMWTGMDVKHKAMLVCIVFFGFVSIVIIVVYIKITVSNRARVQYFKWTRVQEMETRNLNETFSL
ncbi:uncharacterized protein LOC134259914 [Saccostrea cucullata]|uniref:uncharacterized protein LOC134259914 n=1 Tax=Saccostrea cuccullata TaxID=36930 RepID=UPI002ED47E30